MEQCTCARLAGVAQRVVLGLAAAVGLSLALVPTPAHAAATVRIGTSNSSSDVGFYIAHKKGYFRQEGIEATFIPFDSAGKMIPSLGTGQIEVGGGAPSAGLYNAVGRGIDVKIVADKGSTPAGHGYQPLLVRKDLVASGKFKGFQDLKGLRIASGATGISTSSTLNEALKKGGLSARDVIVVNLGYPHHVAALLNGAVDASLTTEPSATLAVDSGAAVRFAGDDVIYPNHQLAVVIYGGGFIKDNPETAKKFMRAYLRAIRDYNDALQDGKLAGPQAEEIIAILTEYTSIKDANVYRSVVAHGTNPDGRVNMPSLEQDFEFFKEQGLLNGKVSVAQAVDNSFVDATLKELGPYSRRAQQ